jgi:hypothetical protein
LTASPPDSRGQDGEQLRRLKNTIMGASNRLAILARSGQLTDPESGELAQASAQLASVAQRLERMLSRRRNA